MIVKIGSKNRLTNLLFNIKEVLDKDDLTLINKNTIDKLIEMSFGIKVSKYEIIIEKNFVNSQFITIEDDKTKKYIMFSFEQPNDTRNGYILTKVPIAFRTFITDTTSKEKSFEICLLDVEKTIYEKNKDTKIIHKTYETKDLNIDKLISQGTINNYNIFAYKLLKTCNIKIINENALPFKDFIKTTKNDKRKQYIKSEINIKNPFKSIEELKTYRLNLGTANTGNKSSYIIETDEYIVIYGKTFGNNGFEVIMLACGIAELAKKDGKKVFLYQIKDNLGVGGSVNKDAKPISKDSLELLKGLNIEVYDELQEYETNPEAIIDENKDSRNQLEFMKNLMIKYGEPGKEDIKKCYLCGCTIQKTIIASHIQRVCDINKLSLSFDEKRKKATDGNNGFWLCANHDKMFEYGIISFDESTGEFVLGQDYLDSEKLSKEQIDYINEITKSTMIDPKHFTDELKEYLKIHNERIKKENLKKKP